MKKIPTGLLALWLQLGLLLVGALVVFFAGHHDLAILISTIGTALVLMLNLLYIIWFEL